MRPDFSDITTSSDFLRWYWLKEEMIQICKDAHLSYTGSKFLLRDRIAYALDHDGAILLVEKKSITSKFNWTKAKLKLDTPVTDSISFGPNFKKFMVSQIGAHYKANIAFMDWVRSNVGVTLKEVVEVWIEIEEMKRAGKRSNIPDHNMLNKYVRDFLDDNDGRTFKDALECWHYKRRMPMEDGLVRYSKKDVIALLN